MKRPYWALVDYTTLGVIRASSAEAIRIPLSAIDQNKSTW